MSANLVASGIRLVMVDTLNSEQLMQSTGQQLVQATGAQQQQQLQQAQHAPSHEEPEEEEETPEVDINISNVVSNFSTRCHLNLRTIAMNGTNVEYRRDKSRVVMKIRHPKITAFIWSSGKITCIGATSVDEAKKAARRVARILQQMSFKVKFSSYRVVNVLGSVILPFGIKIAQFTEEHRTTCRYEPELHPGATYRYEEAGATLKIFQTGAITITAPSVEKVQLAVEYIYPLVYAFKKDKPAPHTLASCRKRVLVDNNHNTSNGAKNGKRRKVFGEEEDTDELFIADPLEEYSDVEEIEEAF